MMYEVIRIKLFHKVYNILTVLKYHTIQIVPQCRNLNAFLLVGRIDK